MRTSTIGCALLLGLLVPIGLQAQATGRISGVVTSDAGLPVPNAQIAVPGAQRRAIADTLGRFTIPNVAPGQYTARATSLGHSPQDVAITVVAGATATANFRLSVIAANLQEVVVVGYGEQKRGTITSAVANVTAEEFVPGPARDAAALLAGKVAGLGITTSNGDPRGGAVNRGTEIQLRGVTTIQGDRNPLVLIDGVPGSLETVPAPDIASISVLKDGSAAAVYGSRASNGVILITTKRHENGKAALRYDGFVSQQTIYHRPDFLTAADYRRLKADGMGFEDLGSSTDWQKQILRNPVSQRHNASIDGGDVGTNYSAAINYDKAEGIFLRSNNEE
ncbi:MAG TPA: carboxypeptidase regulatory-like domain-containing protein, partial [Gemmatimonadaceae bacterium]|nr:carboxypeptidase regulatory-like domain-containing protein [Gemmatimonadaceae bacterium]